METRIGTTSAGNPIPPIRPRDHGPQQERRFILPRRESDDAEDREHAGDNVVLEPQPRRADRDKPVSRALLEDEAGHRIDVRG